MFSLSKASSLTETPIPYSLQPSFPWIAHWSFAPISHLSTVSAISPGHRFLISAQTLFSSSLLSWGPTMSYASNPTSTWVNIGSFLLCLCRICFSWAKSWLAESSYSGFLLYLLSAISSVPTRTQLKLWAKHSLFRVLESGTQKL